MHRLLVIILLLAGGLLAACGSSSSSGTTAAATDAGAAATASATATSSGDAASASGEKPTCSDAEITMVSQQIIGTLNAIQTNITKQWFVMPKVQAAGIKSVTADVRQMRLQRDALKLCTVLSEDQAKLVPTARTALEVATTFANATLKIVDHASLKADIDALKASEQRMNALTLKLNEALAAFSTQWENWKLKQS